MKKTYCTLSQHYTSIQAIGNNNYGLLTGTDLILMMLNIIIINNHHLISVNKIHKIRCNIINNRRSTLMYFSVIRSCYITIFSFILSFFLLPQGIVLITDVAYCLQAISWTLNTISTLSMWEEEQVYLMINSGIVGSYL